MHEVIIQAVGFLGLGFVAIGFQLKTRRSILLCQFFGALSFVVHFLLLGAPTGALINLVGVMRALLFQKYSEAARPQWPLVLVIGMFILAGIVTWEGVISLLPMFAMIFSSYGFWQRSPRRVRQIVMTSPPLWCIYNVLSGSIAGTLTELVNFTSMIVGVWRYRKRVPLEAPVHLTQ